MPVRRPLPAFLGLGLTVAAAYWLLESALHTLVFGRSTLASALLPGDPHELWKRLLVVSLIVAFSLRVEREMGRQRAAERSLLAAHSQLEQIFETASVAMRLVGLDFRVAKVNATFVALSGVPAAQAVGATCREVLGGEQCGTPSCPVTRIAAGAEQVQCEVDKVRRDGAAVPCLLTARPFRDERGELVGVVECFADLTEVRASRAATAEAERLAAVGELAAGVAHEINNPIAGILGYGELLLAREREPAAVRELAAKVVAEAERVAGIVGSLLSFARRPQGEREAASLAALLAETLALVGTQLRKDGIHLEVDVPSDLANVFCVPQEIQQVFVNLIGNARYALVERHGRASGGARLSIDGRRESIDGAAFVGLSFTDNGGGIPAELLDRVTKPFFTTKPRGKGTGLGLSVSQRIVADHGGRLRIESAAGRYTRATVLLPALAKAPGRRP